MEIQEYWDGQAKEFKDNPLATSGDVLAHDLEVKELLKYLKDGQKILDIGCGNGCKDIEFSKQRDIDIKGIDFSEQMIKTAKEFERDKLRFEQGNILALNESEKYDIIITNRCIINLESTQDQIKAINNINDTLKTHGTYLMLECTKSGLKSINDIRLGFGLPEIKERWHNNYLSDEVVNYAKKIFNCIEVNNFNSTYFLISRTINALLGYSYDSDINKYAAELPPLGDYAPLKLFVLEKMETGGMYD